jgi:tetratricopeptide (TPR) repeat protein
VAIDTTSLFASDLLVLGLIFLKLGDKTNAKIQLDKQVELFRSADEWLYLPTGLNSRAKLHLALRDLESATRDLQESLKISEQTGAKFGEWEACLDLAQLHIYKDDYSTAATYLSRARSLPEMNNYRFRDREIEELQSKLEFN